MNKKEKQQEIKSLNLDFVVTTMIVILSLIFSISMLMAIDIYSGESITFESEEFAFFSVIGNSSSMEGMDINWDNGNTTISFHQGFVSDSFTLILFNPEKEIITEHHYSSGGGSSRTKTEYIDRNITKYEFFEKDVPGETITKTNTETIIQNKVPTWMWIVLGIISLVLIVVIIIGIKTMTEKEEYIED